MTPEQNAKIEAGVKASRTFGDSTGLPFTRLAAYIRQLQVDPTWTDAEIIELQTRVIRELLTERNRPSGG